MATSDKVLDIILDRQRRMEDKIDDLLAEKWKLRGVAAITSTLITLVVSCMKFIF